jgi:hypothetical protein
MNGAECDRRPRSKSGSARRSPELGTEKIVQEDPCPAQIVWFRAGIGAAIGIRSEERWVALRSQSPLGLRLLDRDLGLGRRLSADVSINRHGRAEARRTPTRLAREHSLISGDGRAPTCRSIDTSGQRCARRSTRPTLERSSSRALLSRRLTRRRRSGTHTRRARSASW